MIFSKIKHWSTERISQCVLYVLVGLSALVFAAFYLIGYDTPFEEDPNFNAPLLTDVLLMFMFVLLILGIAVGIWAVVKSLRVHNSEDKLVNSVPATKISYSIAGFTFVLLIFTFVLGSSSTMLINGQKYTDAFWLKVSDMFVWSCLIMIVVAVAAVIFGFTRYYRKDRNAAAH
jgi:putative exporter of polyketide antibiotics